MEPLRGYDEWKARHDWSGGGASMRRTKGDAGGYARTAELWWRTYRFVKRQGTSAAWLEEQRKIPLFATFVKEAERHEQRTAGGDRPKRHAQRATTDPNDSGSDA